MKLSQLTTDQAADIMLQIAPDIETLVGDDELAKKIKGRKVTTDKAEAKKLGGITVLSVAAYLLKVHRKPTWNILGALNQMTPEQVGKQPVTTTIKQVMEAIQDEELIGFFMPLNGSEPKTSSDT